MLAKPIGTIDGGGGHCLKQVYYNYITQRMHAYCLFRAIEWFCVQFAQVWLVLYSIVLAYP